MASTVIRGAQIKDSTVQRHDLDTSTVGQAVVTKLVQGSGVTLSSTGADSGTGDVTVSTSAIPLASSSTSGLMNQTSGNTTDFIDGTNASQPLQPVIWSVRLRSFNALSAGNPTFEVDQRNVGTALTNPANGTFIQDRWEVAKSALTGTVNTALQDASTAPIVIPGTTNFGITAKFQRFTVGTAQASLAATDQYRLQQFVEGSQWRELSSDVHSISLLVRSSVASLSFSVALQDNSQAHSLVKLCTLGAANTWTLITLPNLPVWSGSFSAAPGQTAYILHIVLAAGTTYTAAASSAWQTGNLLGVTGMSNFLATAGATFDLAFIQHQPGAVCATLIDCPFTDNLFACKRYYQKSWDYNVAPGFAGGNGYGAINPVSGTTTAAYGTIPLVPAMAKSPTFICYSNGSGSPNTVYQGGDVAASIVGGQGAIMQTIRSSGNFSTTAPITFHFTADTGW